MRQLKSIADFERLIKKGESFVIYKHSPRCSISNKACHNVDLVMKDVEDGGTVVYQVDVIDNKDVSEHISTFSRVKHESPQVLLFEKNKNNLMTATEFASHGLLSTQYIQGVVNRALGKKGFEFSSNTNQADIEKKAEL